MNQFHESIASNLPEGIKVLLNLFDLDPRSVIITIILIYPAWFILKILSKHFRKWADLVFDELMNRVGLVLGHQIAARTTIRRYCRAQLESTANVVHVPARDARQLPLDSIYTPLKLQKDDGDYQEGEGVHKITGGALIVGDPGSGKSSLVKKLYRDCCRRLIRRPFDSKFPVLFELKNMRTLGEIPEQNPGGWLYDQLREYSVRGYSLPRIQDSFDLFARESGVLFLLDGLDEVASEHYPQTVQALRHFITTATQFGSRNAVIITMRTQFHWQVKFDLLEEFPLLYTLQPFTPQDIYEFLSRWPFTDKNRSAEISRIHYELADKPTLREMCRNPLVLSMYVAENQANEAGLSPDTRTEFYDKVLSELIVKRRMRQRAASLTSRLQVERQREELLGSIALQHMLDQQQPANSLNWSKAIECVKENLKLEDELVANDYFRDLAKETGLVAEERPGETFRFIHLTFCEFLAAKEAIQGAKNGWSRLLEAYSTSAQDNDGGDGRHRLTEVIPFAVGLAHRRDHTSMIGELAGLRAGPVLARAFLECKDYQNSFWPKFLEAEMDFLLKYPEPDEQWMMRLHLLIVVAKDAASLADGLLHNDLEEFLVELSEIHQDRISQVLADYAQHDAASAIRIAEICGTRLMTTVAIRRLRIENLHQKAVLEPAKSKIEEDFGSARPMILEIAEAGLESSLTSHILSGEEPIHILDSQVEELSWRHSWFVAILGKNFYSQCLSISSSFELSQEESDALPLVKELKEIDAPAKGLMSRLLFRLDSATLSPILMMTTLLSALLLILVSDPFMHDIPETKQPVLAVLMLMMFSFLITIGVLISRTLIRLLQESEKTEPFAETEEDGMDIIIGFLATSPFPSVRSIFLQTVFWKERFEDMSISSFLLSERLGSRLGQALQSLARSRFSDIYSYLLSRRNFLAGEKSDKYGPAT